MSVREPLHAPDRVVDGPGWSSRFVALLVLLILPSELTYITFAYPLNASVQIGTEFQTTQIAWLQTGFALMAAVTATLNGKVADIFGKRRVLFATMGVVVLGSLIAAFAPNFGVLMIGRMLQGPALSIPFLIPALIRDIFPRRTVPLAVSMTACGSGITSIAAALLVGRVIDNLGWQATFWLPALFGVILMIAVRVAVPEGVVRADSGRSLDLLGAALLGGCVGGLLLAISKGETWGWTSGRVLGLGAVGVVLLVVWWMRSLRIADPLLDLRELRSRPLLLTLGLAAITTSAATWFYVLMPMIALTPGPDWGLGLTSDGQSVLASAISAGQFISGLVVGWALAKRAAPTVALAAVATVTVGFGIAALSLQSPVAFGVAAFLSGAMGGAGYAVAYYLVLVLTAPERQATMSAVATLSGNLFSAILPVVLFAVMNSMATTAPDGVTHIYPVNAMYIALLVPAVLGLIGMGLALALRGTRRLASPTAAVAAAVEG